MSNEFRHNHYVPPWYQKHFILPGQKDNELLYLDLRPGFFVDPRGTIHQKTGLKRSGFKQCFAEDDLYTSNFADIPATAIEQVFFGVIDDRGRKAVDYFTDFSHPSVPGREFHDMMRHMCTQKLRTPKGLAWLASRTRSSNQQLVLRQMLRFQQLFAATWTEAVWQIADATESETKFIVSDHPVTVYNRACGPRSDWCRESNDPDIWLNATHTIFPLTLEKVLILTNLSWVRNPYQREIGLRPNPNPLRSAIIKFTDVQTLRHLSEQEVREINFIVKSRAYRYVAAAEEDWLHPERYVSKADWAHFGQGYLLMPDPRPIHGGGTIFWGGGPGPGGAMDAYGRSPGDPDFEKEDREANEFETLQRFKGEFASLFGPRRRGRTFGAMSLDKEEDSATLHESHLRSYRPTKRNRGHRP